MLLKKLEEDMKRTQTRGLTKSLRPDEIEFLKENIKDIAWQKVTKIINQHRPEKYLISWSSVYQQCMKLGIIKDRPTKRVKRKQKPDTSLYVDHREFDWYYK